MAAQPELAIRDMSAIDDLNFIQSSWLRSFRESKWIGPVSPRAYWPAYQETVAEILERATVRVLTTTADPTDILGYIVFEPGDLPTVHYLYTKHSVRKQGIATALLRNALHPGNACSYTFRTHKSILFSKRFYLTWNPKLVSDRRYEPENS